MIKTEIRVLIYLYMKKYIFGYGSLINQKSLQKTLPGKKIKGRIDLIGYQRKFNFPAEGHLFLNIVPRKRKKVKGVIIPVTDGELKKIKKRETGYKCVDVTNRIMGTVDGHIFAFIAPDDNFPNLRILRSYLNTCLNGVSEKERAKWLKETIIENTVEEDSADPKYGNVDPALNIRLTG